MSSGSQCMPSASITSAMHSRRAGEPLGRAVLERLGRRLARDAASDRLERLGGERARVRAARPRARSPRAARSPPSGRAWRRTSCRACARRTARRSARCPARWTAARPCACLRRLAGLPCPVPRSSSIVMAPRQRTALRYQPSVGHRPGRRARRRQWRAAVPAAAAHGRARARTTPGSTSTGPVIRSSRSPGFLVVVLVFAVAVYALEPAPRIAGEARRPRVAGRRRPCSSSASAVDRRRCSPRCCSRARSRPATRRRHGA